ncbi:AI-2E family transporter [Novosphingobium marinum]|uniref:Putative PurR-regulated permease PerM n=1 Tax=Novosphingobium marinum TaxID=1514948 RepID=A0A7Y9XV45_9SPHN|nr:AI-2E family transporter [Novosphingobium marinum]NYH95139.1 putative PurR-regulated permease PerM [Novosphingobium marinum]GGC24609.1 AI-2E family transporter [Novosphingobium marinum]
MANDDPRLKGPNSDRHGAGPTDIQDPLMRVEARRALVWLGIASLIALAVFVSQSILTIFGGIVFAALIDGGARLLGRVLDIGRTWRVAIVLILTAIFLVWLVMFAGSQIAAQAASLPAILERQTAMVLSWLEEQGFGIRGENVRGMAQQVLGGMGQLTSMVGGIIGAGTTMVLIVVLGIYISLEPKLYNRGVAWMVPRHERDYYRETASLMGRSLRRLLAGRLLGMVIEGVATWALLAIYGVPMAALLGILTGLLAFIPNIGAIVSGLLMVLVGFSGGTDMGLYTIGVYVFVQAFDGYIVIPMVARRTVDMPPALTLGAQLIMGVLFGILGLFLADPLVAMIKTWFERSAARHEEEAQAEET